MFSNIEFDFSGKIVVVVGGSRGIGRGVVEAFVGSGARVFYAARTEVESVTASGAEFIRCDLAHHNDIRALFKRLDEVGSVDVLVNCAAINFTKRIESIPVEEWQEVLAVNLEAAFLVCQAALSRMRKQQGGKIVNVSSIAGRHRSGVSGVHYVASKAGLLGLTRQLAFEFGRDNVNINVLCPSQTMTDMLRESMSSEQIKALEEAIPLRRVAEVREQVGPILFLCSDAASYITGACIDTNGGQL